MGQGYSHIAFAVEGLDALAGKLEEAGDGDFERKPHAMSSGTHILFVREIKISGNVGADSSINLSNSAGFYGVQLLSWWERYERYLPVLLSSFDTVGVYKAFADGVEDSLGTIVDVQLFVDV